MELLRSHLQISSHTHSLFSLSCRYRFAYVCGQKDKEDFFREYENDLNFVHIDASEMDGNIVRQKLIFADKNFIFFPAGRDTILLQSTFRADIVHQGIYTSHCLILIIPQFNSQVPFTAALDLVQSRQVVVKNVSSQWTLTSENWGIPRRATRTSLTKTSCSSPSSATSSGPGSPRSWWYVVM